MRVALDHFWATLGLLWDHFGFTLGVAGGPLWILMRILNDFWCSKGSPGTKSRGARMHQGGTKRYQGGTREEPRGQLGITVRTLCGHFVDCGITF